MVNSRAKGKRGELEARDQVRKYWLATECIRAGQACGAFSADLLNALPHTHVEVKRYQKLACFKFYEQALRDAKGDMPIVLMKQDGSGWLVMFAIEDSQRFAQALETHTHAP